MDRFDTEGINQYILERMLRYDLTGREEYPSKVMDPNDPSEFEEHRIYIKGMERCTHMGAIRAIFDCYGETFDFHSWSMRSTAEVSYYSESHAIQAIAETNVLNLGKFTIQTGWAEGYPRNRSTVRNFDQEFEDSNFQNCTIFCGGLYIDDDAMDELLETVFSPFGLIEKIFHWKDFAFVRFSKKADASCAISTIDGTLVNNFPVICKWSNLEEERNMERQLCTFSCLFVSPFAPTATSCHSDVAISCELATPSSSTSQYMCLNKKIDLLFLPCAHVASCSEHTAQAAQVCPVCGDNCTYKIKVYYT